MEKNLIKRLRDDHGDSEVIDEIADALEAQQARIAELRGELTHISEYWNGDANEMAMHDACTHVVDAAREALANTDDISALQELKARYEARIAELREALQFYEITDDDGTIATTAISRTDDMGAFEDLECKAYMAGYSDAERGFGPSVEFLAAHDAEIYKQGRACGIAEAAEGKVVMFSREGLAAHDAAVRKAALLEAADRFVDHPCGVLLRRMAGGEK